MRASGIVLLRVPLPLGGCGPGPEQQQPKEARVTSAPHVSLEAQTLDYAVGEPIPITVRLRNDSPDAIIVNKRLALNSQHAPAQFSDVALIVKDANGQQKEFLKRIRIGNASEGDFTLLEPGASVERSYNAAEYYQLTEPGAYTIEARYQNRAQPAGGEAWQGELSSNILRLAIR